MESFANPLEVSVRQIEPRDAEAVCLLILELGYERPLEAVVEWIGKLAPEPDGEIAFVACLAGELVGWIELSIERRLQTEPFAFIGGLVVKDGLRGKGIGRRLCKRAETWSWQQGVKVVRVTSRSTRLDAHRFYVRDGYTTVKTSMVFEKRRPE